MEVGDLSSVKKEYNEKLAGLGDYVEILGNGTEQIGISRGITDMGQLIVEFPDGKRKEIISGEVSVRGLYGYV